MGWIKKNLAPMPPSNWKKEAGLIKWYGEDGKEKEKKRKGIAKVSKRKKERLKNEGSEKALFLAVWTARADATGRHWCEICGCEIREPRSWCFSHNLSKGRYPEYRLYDKNITLVCSEACHRENDRRNVGRDMELIQALTSNKK